MFSDALNFVVENSLKIPVVLKHFSRGFKHNCFQDEDQFYSVMLHALLTRRLLSYNRNCRKRAMD